MPILPDDANWHEDEPMNYWSEHPLAEDWRYEVANGDTRQGFWEWLEAQEE